MAIVVNQHEHIRGQISAPIELVEYADYQCPYCRKAFYVMRDIQERLGQDLMFAFRNFPLTELHANAMNAALAAEAAAQQGKFWEMQMLLFDNQQYLQDYNLLEYAQKLKLDVSKFQADMNSEKCLQKVQKDYQSGVDNGVEGTPTFFINGKRFEGDWRDDDFADFLLSFIE
ncbi:protein-disulfide isomerase [Parabacteroides sp. PF5-5]|uniref:DsbA family protein n=1 Tax=unclassified Parabacteroides TaxID=2649774 RepID=UPI0024766143|nr:MULTISPECIES: DsbA family protein [unclassified Parabacteroides]MDH6306587.1 protein-disulfide isomerase [Parabacteroides sp. PH5-39]MDH6317554.1 protein-disulfide isomerase [Parabacteroides sp. PF5-13]MDH6321298.1 protein-disulfide isomerase [Parabacteroides sp. PH5-13]MDH6325030.1 protein-disulfide isomerase [Parabacteroides sp. PH5-8]MDH6328739.1 protein-disulfide isomerase [Parabacteroides sp. PH5-41]